MGLRAVVADRSDLRVLFWIRDAGVQHRHQSKTETFRDQVQIPECQIAFDQLSVRDPLADQFTHELLDLLRRRFFQTARRAFDYVGQADYRAFFRLRLRAVVAESLFAHLWDVVLA